MANGSHLVDYLFCTIIFLILGASVLAFIAAKRRNQIQYLHMILDNSHNRLRYLEGLCNVNIFPNTDGTPGFHLGNKNGHTVRATGPLPVEVIPEEPPRPMFEL